MRACVCARNLLHVPGGKGGGTLLPVMLPFRQTVGTHMDACVSRPCVSMGLGFTKQPAIGLDPLVKLQLQPYLNLGTRGRQMVCFTLRPDYHLPKHWIGGYVSPRICVNAATKGRTCSSSGSFSRFCSSSIHRLMERLHDFQTKQTSWPLVRKRTTPTDRSPLVGEVSAKFCG
jgi:hypothetical protein